MQHEELTNGNSNFIKLKKFLPTFIFITIFFSLFIFTLNEKYEVEENITISNSTSGSLFTPSAENDTIDDKSASSIKEKVIHPLTEEEKLLYSSYSYDDKLKFLHNTDYTLEDRITVFLSDDINDIGFIYYNLHNNESITFNEDSTFTAASVYKVGLVMYTYYLANIGQANLDDIVYYIDSDFEDGSGILQNEDYIGGRTVQELLDLAIIYSDNIASNMLWRYLGGFFTFKYGLYDLLDVEFEVAGNTITPNIELKILKYIYDNRNDPNFSHMIDTMQNTIFNDRIDKYIPKEIVAHKIGDYGGATNDVGIIFADSHIFLLSLQIAF